MRTMSLSWMRDPLVPRRTKIVPGPFWHSPGGPRTISWTNSKNKTYKIMDRRKSLKSIVLGSVAGGLALHGCNPGEGPKEELSVAKAEGIKWMTAEENKLMDELQAEQFFNPHELATLTVLCDLILPGDGGFKSASDAEVVPFIEFMVKDVPELQVDFRGGLLRVGGRGNADCGTACTAAG